MIRAPVQLRRLKLGVVAEFFLPETSLETRSILTVVGVFVVAAAEAVFVEPADAKPHGCDGGCCDQE